jgi:hypothetical protein
VSGSRIELPASAQIRPAGFISLCATHATAAIGVTRIDGRFERRRYRRPRGALDADAPYEGFQAGRRHDPGKRQLTVIAVLDVVRRTPPYVDQALRCNGVKGDVVPRGSPGVSALLPPSRYLEGKRSTVMRCAQRRERQRFSWSAQATGATIYQMTIPFWLVKFEAAARVHGHLAKIDRAAVVEVHANKIESATPSISAHLIISSRCGGRASAVQGASLLASC